VGGYCVTCRKKLFDGKKIGTMLNFDAPSANNISSFQERSKGLSISGVQLKYSLKLQGKELVLADTDGHFILKPIPPTILLSLPDQAPENEHLTMQIASQLFEIPVAENALIFFKDGTPAYITKRFDVKPDNTRYLQEDFAQVSGKTKQSHGEHYKYDGTYEEGGMLIKQYIPAYIPALEIYFKTILFNYIFSNGDAHLKNFSIIQSAYNDYTLSKAYDLMSTVLHTFHENDTALDLYKDDTESEYYQQYGCYGRPDFEMLAEKLSIKPVRVERIINAMLGSREAAMAMIRQSYLSDEAKEKYRTFYMDKIQRFR
jgi:serine/threonine-protein kinase HipA